MGDATAHLLLGLPLMALSCFCASSGLLLIKASGMLEADKPFIGRPRWFVGFFLLAGVASALDIVVYGLLPLSLVAPFAGLTMALTLYLASTGLLCPAESLTWTEVVGTLFVASGVGATSTFGPRPTESSSVLSVDELQARTMLRLCGRLIPHLPAKPPSSVSDCATPAPPAR